MNIVLPYRLWSLPHLHDQKYCRFQPLVLCYRCTSTAKWQNIKSAFFETDIHVVHSLMLSLTKPAGCRPFILWLWVFKQSTLGCLWWLLLQKQRPGFKVKSVAKNASVDFDCKPVDHLGATTHMNCFCQNMSNMPLIDSQCIHFLHIWPIINMFFANVLKSKNWQQSLIYIIPSRWRVQSVNCQLQVSPQMLYDCTVFLSHCGSFVMHEMSLPKRLIYVCYSLSHSGLKT